MRYGTFAPNETNSHAKRDRHRILRSDISGAEGITNRDDTLAAISERVGREVKDKVEVFAAIKLQVAIVVR